MMFDEPFVGQDPITCGVLMHLIRQLNSILNMTIIIVSHDVEECFALADYIYILSQGKIVGAGTPEQIQSSQDNEVRQFISGAPDGTIPFHYEAPSFEREIFNVC